MAIPNRVRAARPNNAHGKGSAPKLDQTVTRQLCALVEEGLGFESALNYLGIRPEPFFRWINKGELYWRTNATNPKFRIYGEFVMALRKAQAVYVLTQTRDLRQKKGWFRALNVLERRDRKTWARREPQGGSLDSYDPDEKKWSFAGEE